MGRRSSALVRSENFAGAVSTSTTAPGTARTPLTSTFGFGLVCGILALGSALPPCSDLFSPVVPNPVSLPPRPFERRLCPGPVRRRSPRQERSQAKRKRTASAWQPPFRAGSARSPANLWQRERGEAANVPHAKLTSKYRQQLGWGCTHREAPPCAERGQTNVYSAGATPPRLTWPFSASLSSHRLWCCRAQLTSTSPLPMASKAPCMPMVPM